MPLPRTMPALADLTQDIAGPLPLHLLQEWAAGTRDVETAADLLSGFQIEGVVVATDSSGLSRLTGEKDLLDLLAIVSAPKAIVHAVGVAVGGRAIGTWVADNTEMFFPGSVPADTVVAAAAEAQHRNAEAGGVGIGMCIHQGRFYEIGGGLYGRDADIVESLAEHDARGGEILVTDAIRGRLDAAGPHRFEARTDARSARDTPVFTLAPGRRLPGLQAINAAYPHPFPPEFFARLTELHSADRAAEVRAEIYARYLQQRAVVFLALAHDGLDGSLATLLDDLVTNAVMETVIRSTAGAESHIAGIGGGLCILTFDSPREAVDFAISIRARFVQNAVPVKAGIDVGPVLLFSNAHGRSGITGEPVNVASKVSEDVGAPGRINITSRAAAGLASLPPDCNQYDARVSGLTLTGIFV